MVSRKVNVNIKARAGNEGASGFTTFFEDSHRINDSPDHRVQENIKDLRMPRPRTDFDFGGRRIKKRGR